MVHHFPLAANHFGGTRTTLVLRNPQLPDLVLKPNLVSQAPKPWSPSPSATASPNPRGKHQLRSKSQSHEPTAQVDLYMALDLDLHLDLDLGFHLERTYSGDIAIWGHCHLGTLSFGGRQI